MQVSLVAKKEEEKKRACLNLLLIRPSTQTERENRRRGGWEGSSHIGWIQGRTQSQQLLTDRQTDRHLKEELTYIRKKEEREMEYNL